MLIGSILKDQLPQLTLNRAVVERVTTFKLLGVHVSSSRKWAQHVDATSSRVLSQLYFCFQQSQVGSARRRNIVQGLVSTVLCETAQVLQCNVM